MSTPWIAEVTQDALNDWVVKYLGDEGEVFTVLFSGPWAELRAKAYRAHIQPMMDADEAWKAGG